MTAVASSFYVQPGRFRYVALDPVTFVPGTAANTWRGAFGLALRSVGCRPDCFDVAACLSPALCGYRELFAPASATGPSGLRQPPRPFMLRAQDLDAGVFPPGSDVTIDLHLFTPDPRLQSLVVDTMARIGLSGLGSRQSRLRLAEVQWTTPLQLPFAPALEPVQRVEVTFLTPTELKEAGEIVREPRFEVLFGRIRDRLSALTALYSPAPPPEVDYAALGERAEAVRLVTLDLHAEQRLRRSRRTGQVHGIGGFTGTAVYEGALAEFRPWLDAAVWAGVGRHTVWGNGALSLTWYG